MPQMPMTVTKIELTGANQGKISAECVNGAIQGTITITASKIIVKAVDPGDILTVVFTKA